MNSKLVTNAVKRDGFVNKLRIIDHAAKRLAEDLKHPFLRDYFNDSVALVPIRGEAPLVPNALWPALRICQAIRAKGLAASVLPCVERTQPVRKAATATPGQRPTRPTITIQRESLCRRSFRPREPSRSLTTSSPGARASSESRSTSRTRFQGVPIRYFALIRTISAGDVASILDPVQGTVSFTGGQLNRHP